MNLKRKYSFYNKVAGVLAFVMLVQSIYPTAMLALTSGPGNPEFSSFEPVATTSMVNEFNGGFTYNIPVLDIPGANGGGYACALSYHSGENVESEASWVGHGWSLNPGAINRNKRGIADDANGKKVIYKNDVPSNWTVSAGGQAGNIEAFSVDIPLSVSGSLRYNNYKGFGYTAGVGLSYRKGLVSLGYSISDGSGSFSFSVNPAAALSFHKESEKQKDAKAKFKDATNDEKQKKINAAAFKDYRKSEKKVAAMKKLGAVGTMGSSYGMHAFGDDLRATNASPYIGTSFNMSISNELDPVVPVGIETGFNANLTTQTNIPTRAVSTYGYLYSKNASNDNSSDGCLMDYYNEKDATYNKRERYMSIPFSNADMYSVTGEGVGGGFRLYNKNVGTFFPNEVSSYTGIEQIGYTTHTGGTVGVGANIGIGFQQLDVKKTWDENGNTDSYNFSGKESDGCFFRFSGDKGGALNYASSTKAASAGLDIVSNVPGFKSARVTVPEYDIYKSLSDTVDNGLTRSGRSSYIAYHTNDEMTKTSPTSKKYYAHQHDSTTETWVNRTDDYVKDGIGELAVNNEDGNKYVYGLPVYSKNETNLQYDLRGTSSSDIRKNYVAYKSSTNHKIEVGEINNNPYATSYLLTEITTPDYVDRSLNGPSDDDFGGYTKFSYTRAYGSTDKFGDNTSNWYHWRIPYTGLAYNPNDLTDNLDDVGGFSSGYKEIYYLKQIETKTHIAVFVTNKTNFTLGGSGGIAITGSQAVRQDGLQAGLDENAIKKDTAKGYSGSHKLEMLERIELYTKPVDGSKNYKLLKTTRFEYDYSLCGNVPNNIGSAIDKNGNTPSSLPNINANKGKLTLRKVWFEYEGVVNAHISPYVFNYSYPTSIGTNGLSSVYNSIKDYGASLADTIQNPKYSPFNIDRWGNPQPNGEARHDSLMTHVDQTVDLTKFDPAAWQLKRIQLPSGGEILVQYEQNDYLYVQDRRALAMVSLKADYLTTPLQDLYNKFYLNVEKDLGITSDEDKLALVKLIRDEFREKKIFFKYFYALVGNSADLHSCYSDYVKGYVDVDSCNVDSHGIYLKLGQGNTFSSSTYQLPRNVCIDYVKKEKGGKLKPIGNCNASDGGIPENPSPLTVVQQLISKIGTTLFPEATCLTLNENVSCLRIPVLHAKKGGGVRVKRILMHDNGIETGDEALYGSEYIYKSADGETSGVATNEPSEGKEENALVTYLARRNDQSIVNKVVAGKDKEQFEGPIGEYLLPPPSIGYGRVMVKNIHSGKTNTGFSVNEFYTAKDYPFDKYYNTSEVVGNAIDNTGIAQKKDWLLIPASYVNISISNLWLSQGYRFVLNEMHGQIHSVATYSGSFDSAGVPDSLMLSSKQEYNYYEPGEQIPLMTDINKIEMGNPGKETEVVMERKAVEDVSVDGSIEMDVSVGLIPPLFPPYFSFFPSVNYNESKLRTHVTTKVIHYPVIQKSVKTYQDGIYHLTENLAFSPYTGKPLLTKTTDGYDKLNLQQSSNHNGTYLSYSIPAAKAYKEMGQKSSNEGLIIFPGAAGTPWSTITCSGVESSGNYSLKFTATSGNSVCSAMRALNRGDLVKVVRSSDSSYFNVDETSGSTIALLPARLYNSTLYTSTVNVSKIEVIKSGKSNQLNVIASTFTTYGANSNITFDTLNASQLSTLQTAIGSLNTSLASLSGGDSVNVTVSIPQPTVRGTCSSESTCITLKRDATTGVITLFTRDKSCGYTTCSQVLGVYLGYFAVNNQSGTVTYYTNDNPCNPIPVSCIQTCSGVSYSISNVVAANASVFDQTWPYDTTVYQYSSQAFSPYNDYETGVKGKWRMSSSYVYNNAVTSGSKQGTTERNYKDAGTFPMVLFNWQNSTYNDSTQWVKTNSVSHYSPNGEAIEEKDAIGVYSSAKYGYKGMLPYLVAKNADYASAQFESFENIYSSTKLEEGVTIVAGQTDNTYAHAGKSSLKLVNTSISTPGTPSAANLVLKPFSLSNQISTKGLELKVWVKDPGYAATPIAITLSDSANTSLTQNLTLKKVAQTGEWTLYSAHVTSFTSGLSKIITTISNAYPYSSTASSVWIDDVRVQPYDAQVMAYVYDKNKLKVLASFDDQNFGLFYQYNAEGKLVRKKIETEKGIKTIQETQYHSPLQARQ